MTAELQSVLSLALARGDFLIGYGKDLNTTDGVGAMLEDLKVRTSLLAKTMEPGGIWR